MSKVFLTCDLNNLSIVNGAPVCSEWEYMTPMFPMFELTLPELSAVMGATALFLAICYSGRGLLKQLLSPANSD